MPQTNLKPESGAEFFGKIEHLTGERLFRASCYAQLRQGESLERDAPRFWMCATEAAAQKWIEVQAAVPGFPRYTVVQQSDRGVDRLGRGVGRETAPRS
jgi:hypothetical protein